MEVVLVELSWLGRAGRECRAVPGLDLPGQSTVKVSRFKAQGNKSKGLLLKAGMHQRRWEGGMKP